MFNLPKTQFWDQNVTGMDEHTYERDSLSDSIQQPAMTNIRFMILKENVLDLSSTFLFFQVLHILSHVHWRNKALDN